MRRALELELRKAIGTRGRRLLVLVVVLLCVAIGIGSGLVQEGRIDPEVALHSVAAPLYVLVPVLVLVLFATEWSAREAVYTFVLVPDRRLVLAAKGLVAVAVCAASVVLLAVVVIVQVAVTDSWAALDSRVVAARLGGAFVTVLAYGALGAVIGAWVRSLVLGIVLLLAAPVLVTGLASALPVGLSRAISFDGAVAALVNNPPSALGPELLALVIWLVVPGVLAVRSVTGRSLG